MQFFSQLFCIFQLNTRYDVFDGRITIINLHSTCNIITSFSCYKVISMSVEDVTYIQYIIYRRQRDVRIRQNLSIYNYLIIVVYIFTLQARYQPSFSGWKQYAIFLSILTRIYTTTSETLIIQVCLRCPTVYIK